MNTDENVKKEEVQRALSRYELVVLEIVSRTTEKDRPFRGQMPKILVERGLVAKEDQIPGFWITEAGAEMLERQKPTPTPGEALVAWSEGGAE